MKKFLQKILCVGFAGFTLLSPAAFAAPPQTINYQGVLTDTGGTAINTPVVMTFRLYNAASGGAALWTETQLSVNVVNGRFNAVLGSVPASPLTLPFDVPYWLTVSINADAEMSPRQPLASSPYAFRASTLDSAATLPGLQISGTITTATLPTTNLTGTIGTAQIAGNAVTQAKLSPVSGAAAGKVLGTDGSNLQWLTAGVGSVTAVGTGSGLTGGPITGSGTISLAATQLLPTTACATNQIAKWNSSAWSCAADDNAPAGGTTGQILTGTAGAPAWSGSPTLSGNLILPGNTTASAGTIMKAGTRFMHYYGFSNTFIGEGSGNFTMSGGNNTGNGVQALLSNTTGTYNTAGGANALLSNTTGGVNTANGGNALFSNTIGTGNTVSGAGAMQNSITSSFNTVSGVSAMVNAGKVVAAGSFASTVDYTILTVGTTDFTLIGAASNTVGAKFSATGPGTGTGTAAPDVDLNTVSGYQAMYNHANGRANTASGYQTLFNSTTSHNNTAMGYHALYNTTTGVNNIAIGLNAGVNLTTGFFNINIGNDGVAGDSYTTRIGSFAQQFRTFISGIYGTSIAGSGIAVSIDSNGQLGTTASSRRYKDDITDMDAASSALMKLRPVTFHYKADQNPAGRMLQYGLIAEEVNDVYPGLVAHSADGQIETVMYQHLPPMLLNEFQKQQRTIAAQAVDIQKQAAELTQQRARVELLERELQTIKAMLGGR